MMSRIPQRRLRHWLWLGIPFGLALVTFAWWTISPLFLNRTVDEAFPTAAPTSVPAVAEAPSTTSVTLATNTPLASPEPRVATLTPTAATPTPEPTLAPTVTPSEPIALSTGSFTFIDRLHWAEGIATIYQLPDGNRLLRLENFQAQNGPDLRIGLGGHPMPRSTSELYDVGGGYLELEPLKANQGNQNYLIPTDLDLSLFRSAVIYCKAFNIVFSTAELTLQP